MKQTTYQDIDLAVQHILGLLESVVGRSLRASLNLVESRSEVCRRLGLGANGMEVGCSCVLSGREGNELVACAFDDGERNKIAGH